MTNVVTSLAFYKRVGAKWVKDSQEQIETIPLEVYKRMVSDADVKAYGVFASRTVRRYGYTSIGYTCTRLTSYSPDKGAKSEWTFFPKHTD